MGKLLVGPFVWAENFFYRTHKVGDVFSKSLSRVSIYRLSHPSSPLSHSTSYDPSWPVQTIMQPNNPKHSNRYAVCTNHVAVIYYIIRIVLFSLKRRVNALSAVSLVNDFKLHIWLCNYLEIIQYLLIVCGSH